MIVRNKSIGMNFNDISKKVYMIENVSNYQDFTSKIKDMDKCYLLIYKSGSEKSDCAYDEINKALEKSEKLKVFGVDVNNVTDVHIQYNINSAPSLLEFDNGEYKNLLKGCNDSNFYDALFEEALYRVEAKSRNEEKPQKRVTVYSTPSCSWCTRLKTYLKKNRIIFSDVDVSKDPRAAEELVRRSGQQGVPQTDIDGQIIVGFDKVKIDQLLDIKG